MKEIFIAKNYKWLFIKCIIAEILFNVFFCFVYNFNHTYDPVMLDFTLGIMQICIAIGLGIYIRNQNKYLFLNKNNSKKLYVNIIILADLFGLLCFFVPDMITMPYTSLIMFFYNIFKIERIFSLWDLYSCLLCFSVVFLLHRQKNKAVLGS